MSSRPRHDVSAASIAYDLRVAAGITFFVATSAGVGSLLDYELFRAVANRVATTDWTSATYSRAIHEANVTSLRAIAIGLAAFGAALLAFGPTVTRIALGKRAAHPSRRTSLVLWTLLFAFVLLGVRAWFLAYEGGTRAPSSSWRPTSSTAISPIWTSLTSSLPASSSLWQASCRH